MKNWKRSGRFIKHHIINRCKGGCSKPYNLLLLDSEREKAWHKAFFNMSFTEVAQQLQLNMIMFTSDEKKAVKFLFKDKTYNEIAELLLRVVRAKKARH